MIPAAINVTQLARDYINKRCQNGEYIVSIKINSKGCSGHSYEYGLVNPADVGKFDETLIWEGGGISIGAASVMHLLGSTLDLKTSIMESYLVWENPHATDHCGCGVSFALTN